MVVLWIFIILAGLGFISSIVRTILEIIRFRRSKYAQFVKEVGTLEKKDL